jgi:F-type H+-transporting ATPase subunit delta
MPNPRLAARYAKSLVGIAVEKGELESVNNDIEYVKELINISPEFRLVLASPVIKPEKKVAILGSVTKGKIGPITTGFFRLLLKKSRESVLPEIVHSFKDQYNIIKGIHKVRFITAQPVSEEQKALIISKFTADTGLQNILLETKIDESLVGGFVLEYNNKIVDASLKYDLSKLKKSFLRNDYIYNIR